MPDDSADVAAFSAFYRKSIPELVAFLMFQGARLPEATDIAQETMIKVYQSWSEINHPKTWTRQVASRMLARHRTSVGYDLTDEVSEPNPLLPPLIDVEAWEQRHEVLRVLDLLPPRQRVVMAWTLDGYTPSEIANELKITPKAVRANLMEARHTLAAQLKSQDNDE